MTTIKLPPMPTLQQQLTQRDYEQLRARDLEVAKAVLEAAAKTIEELPCECCWPEGSDTVAADFATELRALRIEGETP